MFFGRIPARRLGAALVAGAFVLSACGGGDDGGGTQLPAAESPDFLGRDLGGETVDAASEIPTNQLPDLVVDNVSTGTKVNLRNVVPSDRPILLWMYAPH